MPCRWIGPRLDAHDPRTFAVERIEIAHEGFFAEPLKSEPFERERKPVEEKKEEEKQAEQAQKISPEELKQEVSDWAEKQKESMSGKQKQKFNTACVAYDEITGKCYYGRNAGIPKSGESIHPDLQAILPKEKLCKYEIGNCAEVDAVNKALKDGAKFENLHITTIHANASAAHSFGEYKPACPNCVATFKGRVKKNYSGWTGED